MQITQTHFISFPEPLTSCDHCRSEMSQELPNFIATLFALLQPLRWRCVECVVHHERDVREEQHRYICGANKQ